VTETSIRRSTGNDRSLRELTIDAGKSLGVLRSLQGISSSPRPPIKQPMAAGHFFNE
jgi:hypothetical protein